MRAATLTPTVSRSRTDDRRSRTTTLKRTEAFSARRDEGEEETMRRVSYAAG